VIDDVPTDWRTNEIVLIEAGWHDVTLATPPADFSPSTIAVDVIYTAPTNPKKIKFDKV
jgi:hypothetical protein